jgi:hypothetical protein
MKQDEFEYPIAYIDYDDYRDIDVYLREHFNYKKAEETGELLNRICAHTLHWKLKSEAGDLDAKIVFQKLKENDTLQVVAGLECPTPDMVFQEFLYTVAYDYFRSDKIEPIADSENFEVSAECGSHIILSKTDVERFTRKSFSCGSKPDDPNVDSVSFATVYVFISPDEEYIMRSYLTQGITQINEIYKSLGLKTISLR